MLVFDRLVLDVADLDLATRFLARFWTFKSPAGKNGKVTGR
ncbi:MAG: hypothetical protein R2849_04460 [Thermomicrobiales bacterium]